ncbi:zinc-dependent metalloprotease [Prevotella sp. A2931]|uniref:Zinc-dependent metalloprotease n=1 Tax=Prevotella illustrans TaxID=2800387 RepID=A0ABS3M2F7_9BACT|nr:MULTISPECIES: zinc-dependent metalloprotease [Prevotella]MBO1362343.1 zinc-dependent metalloprotease [Prevotella illustrans]PTL26415.1 zinc-dependent metalloprotease [Prevotella sp. oral taxon 820]
MIIKDKLLIGLFALALPLNAGALTFASADSTQQEVKKANGKADKEKKDDKAADKKKDKDEYAELIKKSVSLERGLFDVRHIENKWYFDVPDSLLGRYILTVTRLTGVPEGVGKFSGEEVNRETVYFEKHDAKTLYLRAYVGSQEADPNTRISQTLRASTVDPIIASFKIIGKNPNKGMNLIEVSSYLMRDNNSIGMPSSSSKQYSIGGMQADRSYIDTIKTFPINVEIRSTRTYSATQSNKIPATSTGNVTLGLNTSMVLLPKTPMRKRLWDKRVGYFTTAVTYFDDDQHKTDPERVAARFRLVPKDKKAYAKGKLVEPEKQIVYYIDPATPKKWVPYLIAGVNDWNTAFEAAGFKNAIVAKEVPEDQDISPDDARYCFLRYLPAEIENAYGPHIIDPRSGEIIESHICWYHNVMNLLTKWYMIQCGPLDKRAQTMHFDDKLMGELIRFVSSHEVGHTLGLRHNMGASWATPVEKLRDKAWVEQHGHTASIMDYARFNYVAQPEDGIGEKGLFPRINDYDKWAIKWGYQYRPEFKDEHAEKKGLMAETTKILATNPRLWFGGEGRDEDPRAQTEDLGDNSMKAGDYGIKNLKRVVANLPKWTRQDNDQYTDLTEMYNGVRDQYRRYCNHVATHLGGRYLNNMPGKEPVEIQPAALQLEALDFLGRHLFEAPLWLYPANIVSKTGVNPSSDILNRQNMLLSHALSTSMLSKIYDDSFMSPRALKLDAYLDKFFSTVWKPLTAPNELSNKCRRSLERLYVSNIDRCLNPQAKDAKTAGDPKPFNTDALLYLSVHLDKIEAFVKGQLDKSSGINKVHYQDLLRQIKLIRDKQTKA